LAISIRFLGVGSASQKDLGHASVVVSVPQTAPREKDKLENLLVDCGPGTVNSYEQHFSSLPKAVFITHCHMDHIADLEHLFF